MFTSSSESVGTTTFFSVILIPYRRAQHCFFSLFFHHSSNKAHTQQCHILALHFSVFPHCSNKAHTKQCYILAFHFSVFLHCSNKTHTQQCHILALHHTTESELTLKITSVLNRCHIVAAIKKKKPFARAKLEVLSWSDLEKTFLTCDPQTPDGCVHIF